MIVTLTPNPSVDRTIELDGLKRGAVHRALRSRIEAGGKGVNVSRCLAVHGVATTAIVTSGGMEGEQLARLLEPFDISVASVPLAAPTRSNVTLVEPDGTTTKLNEPGPTLSADENEAMADRVVALAADAEWVVLSGSLPRGVPDSLYADLVSRVHALGGKVALDTSGAPLGAAVGAKPDVIKPNDEELAELTGVTLATWGDVVAQAEKLRADGVGAVLVSLGADGALLIDDSGTWRAYAAPVEVKSTVAAGDSALTGYLIAGAHGPDALRMAVAFGTAAVTLPGSGMPGPGQYSLDGVTLEENPDLSHPLSVIKSSQHLGNAEHDERK